MKGINWKIRLKNKAFWAALIPAALLLVQAVAAVFGFTFELGGAGERLLNALFSVLTILGIVADPTTEGIGDSKRALGYEEPGQRE